MAVICPICGTGEDSMCIHEKVIIFTMVMMALLGLWLIYGG